MIISLFGSILATLAVIPVVSFFIIYLAVYLYTKERKVAIEWSINITTFLLIISVHMYILQLWQISLLWLLILMILFISIGLTSLQVWIHKEINYLRMVRGTVRLTFLILFVLHLLLFIWVLMKSAIGAAI